MSPESHDHEDWSSGRIADRFAAVDQHLEDIREWIRVFAPLVRDVGELEAAVENIEEDVKGLNDDIKEIVNRSVLLRIAIVVGPIILTCLGIAIAVAFGKLG